jgi:hypothetical protein
MKTHEGECIWVRAEAWLIALSGTMLRVETRKICQGGVFLAAMWPTEYRLVEVLFPDPAAGNGSHRVAGSVTARSADGIWVQFSPEHLLPAEMLTHFRRLAPPPTVSAPAVQAGW